MGNFVFILILTLFTASTAYSEVVEEGSNGYWLDTPEGPDVMEKTIDHMLWVPNPVAIRVSNKDVVFMSSFKRKDFVTQSLVGRKKVKRKKSPLASVHLKIKNYKRKRIGRNKKRGKQTASVNFNSEQKNIIQFLKNWGNSCPGDHNKGVMKPNRVQAVPFQSLEKLFKNTNPDILVFQYQSSSKKFEEKIWKPFIAQVPAYKGCFVVAPKPKAGRVQVNKDYSIALEAFFKKQSHHCQVIHRNSEKNSQDVIQSICDRDYRSRMAIHRNQNPDR